nr:MAG TPA: hypothetical protein [Caudoviricetes sp.]
MVTAERIDVYRDHDDECSFAIAVRDGASSIVVRASSSSIRPRAEYDERRAVMDRFADRIAEAINKGGSE